MSSIYNIPTISSHDEDDDPKNIENTLKSYEGVTAILTTLCIEHAIKLEYIAGVRKGTRTFPNGYIELVMLLPTYDKSSVEINWSISLECANEHTLNYNIAKFPDCDILSDNHTKNDNQQRILDFLSISFDDMYNDPNLRGRHDIDIYFWLFDKLEYRLSIWNMKIWKYQKTPEQVRQHIIDKIIQR